jgi:hypothetical protein
MRQVVWQVFPLRGSDLLFEDPSFRRVFEFIETHRARGGAAVRVNCRRF